MFPTYAGPGPTRSSPWPSAPDLRDLRARIDRLATEMSTGQSSDAGAALRGDFSQLSALRHGAARDASHLEAMRTLGRWGEAGQHALERMDAAMGGLTNRAATMLRPDAGELDALSATAEAAVSDILDALGTRVDGRAIFSGGDAGPAPLPGLGAVLAAARAAAAPAAGMTDLDARMEAFTAPGGGFDALMPPSAGPSAARFPTGEGPDGAGTAPFPLDLSSPGIRSAIKSALVLAVLPYAPAAGAEAEAGPVLGQIGSARAGLATSAGRLGEVEAMAHARATSLEEGLLQAEGDEADLLDVDPAEAATRLQEEINRLETAYALAARLGRLSLVDRL